MLASTQVCVILKVNATIFTYGFLALTFARTTARSHQHCLEVAPLWV